MRRILDETESILRLYMHAVGETEVPRDFHLWSCISMIAGAVADRVWYEKFRGKKLAPNLYVMLIGPSGLGKGEAIDVALKYVQHRKRVNVYAGKATAQHMVKRMEAKGDGKVGGKLYLVTPELAMSVGKGDVADDFIKYMTELYTGRDYPLREGTVTRGEVKLTDYCINWLAGTTKEWLVRCVPEDAIIGGFFGRVVPVMAKYNHDKRVHTPKYPIDYEEVVDHLHARIHTLTFLEGPFTMMSDAEDIMHAWYMNRGAPDDERLLPMWKRSHDTVLKLAMILALMEDMERVIHKRHVTLAQSLNMQLEKTLPEIMVAAGANAEGANFERVRDYIRRSDVVPHSTLLRYMTRFSCYAEQIKLIVETLRQSREIVAVHGDRRGVIYKWTGRKKMPVETGVSHD